MPYVQAGDFMTRVNSTSSQGIQFDFSDHFLPSPSLRPSLPSISIPSYSTSSVNRLLRSASSSESQNSQNSERSDDTVSSPRRVSCALSIDLFDLLDDDVDPVVIVPSPNTSAHPDVSAVHQLLSRTQAAVASVRAIVCPSRVLAKSKSCRNLFRFFKSKSRRQLQVQPYL